MEDTKKWQERVWAVKANTFEETAMELFFHQARHNILYARYLQAINFSPEKISSVEDIPFLPIQFFKTREVRTGNWKPEAVYTSSGTGGEVSRHAVDCESRYLQNAEKIFTRFFGPLSNYHFLALLPSYLERKGSSLISMLNYFMEKSQSPHSGFYLYNTDDLIARMSLKGDRKIMLWGVTYSLLDLAEKGKFNWSRCLILETGGMKGQRAAIIRAELHQILKRQFNVPAVLSEYGMTELLSQAYSTGEGIFKTPPWMKICISDIYDPFQKLSIGQRGRVCVIDLANIHSCAFIETQDAGLLHEEGFELIGRIDQADVRGCNLMVQ